MPLALLPLNESQPLNDPTPLLHNLTEAAIVTDIHWRILIWNRAAEVIYGWHSSPSLAEQVQGKSLWEAIGAHKSERYGISREEAIAHLYQHSHWKGQMLQRHREGREILVESSLQLIRDESGALIGIVNINRPLTKKASFQKQKATQKRYFSHWNSKKTMRPNEARFRIVAETAPVMLWMSGPEALCTFFNQRWLEFTGRSLEEELGNGWTASIHPDDFQQCLETFRRAFNARRSFKIKYRLRRRDGEYRWILDMGVPKLMPSGQLAGYVGSCIDLSSAIAHRYANLTGSRKTSARQSAEVSPISQPEFLQTVLDTTPNLIFVKDAEGKYVFVNQAVADFYGTSLENLIGKLETEFNPHPHRREQFLHDGAEIIATRQEKFIFYQTLVDYNGNVRWFQTIEKPMLMPRSPDNSGSETLYILSVASDITDLSLDLNREGSAFTSKLKSQQTEDAREPANKPLQNRFQERTAALMQANEQMLVEMQSGQWTLGALRPSEAYFRTLLAAMTDVIFVINDEGYYLKIAPTNPKLLCKPAVELIGKTLHEVFERSQADIFLGHIRRALDTQKTIEIDYSLPISTLNNPGRSLLRWFSASIFPLQANTVIWVAREISDFTRDFNDEGNPFQSQFQSQQAEEALRQANEQLEMRVEERTAALRESNDNLVVEIAQRVRAEKELRKHQENLEELVKKRTAELEKSNQQLRQEIVERKRMEQALFQEKELAQVTLQSIGDAVITTDAAGLVTSLNPAAQRLTGWFPPDAIGLPVNQVFHIVHELTREQVENPVETALYSQRIVELSNHTLLISRDGEEFAIDESAAPIRASDGQVVGVVLVFHDVTEERALARRLSWQASHDALTGLANRREFEQHLKRAWLAAQTQNQQHTLCYMDLDRFKYVNDTCGHVAGDELLRQVSTLLQSKVRKTDILARLGGDEFGLLLQYCSLDEAIRVANELRQIIQDFRFLWRDKTCTIGASIGLVGIDAHSNSPTTLMSAADAACYEAKNQGRDRIYVYQAAEGERSLQRQEIQWAVHLPKALESDRFRLYHQPIIAVAATHPIGEHYEVLLRLEDENGNLVSPTAFIPAAERYNLMPTIDRWVIRTLFTNQGQHYRQAWNRCLIHGCQCLYTINLSGASLNDDQFIDFVVEQFTLHEIPPEVICFEITETVAISNLSKAAALVGDLKALGCRFTLDDFGSSVSCLAYLKNLPVDYLKIDGNFVKNIVSDPINCAMVEAINQIAHLMGLQTIAEFVENDDILNKLREVGVDYAQGYGIAKPHPLPFKPR